VRLAVQPQKKNHSFFFTHRGTINCRNVASSNSSRYYATSFKPQNSSVFSRNVHQYSMSGNHSRSAAKCMNNCSSAPSAQQSDLLRTNNPSPLLQNYHFNANQKRIYSFRATPPNSSKNLEKVKEHISHAYQNVPDFNRIIHEFEKMKARPKRLLVYLLCVMLVFAATLYTYWDHLKSFFGKQGAEVASMSLKSEDLQRTSVEMVNSVLTDPNTTNKVVELLKDLVRRDDTKALLVGLVVRIMQDESTKTNLGILLSQQLKILLKDPNTLNVLADFVEMLLKREDTKDNLKVLVWNVLQDEQFKGDVQNWAQDLVLSETVKNSAIQLGLKTVDDVLKNENVRKAGVNYLVGVVTDRKVQSQAGHALRNAALISINPWHNSSSDADHDINTPPSENPRAGEEQILAELHEDIENNAESN